MQYFILRFVRIYLWIFPSRFWQNQAMDNSNPKEKYSEARREFVRDLARALAKIIAANDYAAELAAMESSS
jgi:hypothetical protein